MSQTTTLARRRTAAVLAAFLVAATVTGTPLPAVGEAPDSAAIEGKLGADASADVKALAMALARPDPRDRLLALADLEQMGAKAAPAVEAMLLCVGDPAEASEVPGAEPTAVGRRAIEALVALAPQVKDLPAMVKRAADGGRLGQDATGALRRLVTAPKVAADAPPQKAPLERRIDEWAAARIDETLTQAAEPGRSDDPLKRAEAVRAVAQLPRRDPRAAAFLLGMLAAERSALVREHLVEALDGLRGVLEADAAARLQRALLTVARDPAEAMVRSRALAIIALGNLKAKDAVKPLVELLDGDDADAPLQMGRHAAGISLRALVVWALARTGDPDAAAAITGHLDHANPFVRRYAAWGAGRLGLRSACEPLARALYAEPTAASRQGAAWALQTLTGKAFEPYLTVGELAKLRKSLSAGEPLPANALYRLTVPPTPPAYPGRALRLTGIRYDHAGVDPVPGKLLYRPAGAGDYTAAELKRDAEGTYSGEIPAGVAGRPFEYCLEFREGKASPSLTTYPPQFGREVPIAVAPDTRPPEQRLVVMAVPAGPASIKVSWRGWLPGEIEAVEVLRGEGEAGKVVSLAKLKPSATGYADNAVTAGVAYRYALRLHYAGGRAGETAAASARSSRYLRRINCGGPAFVGPDGVAWEADQEERAGSQRWTYKDEQVAGAGALATIYQTERWSDTFVAYDFDVPPGAYEVVLHFAELHPSVTKRGVRKFDIIINGAVRKPGADVYARAGGRAKPWVFRCSVQVRTEKLVVLLRAVQNGPAIKGIEVRGL